MLRLNRLAFLLLACFSYLSGAAQATSCSADFSYSVGNNYSVTFFSKDSLETKHHWTFGDGTPTVLSSNGMAIHQYAKPGKYEVKHFIEKPNCRDSVVKIITVESTDQCSAAFAYQKKSGNFSYQFFNNSKSAGGIKESSWTFGDGAASHDSSPAHTYAKPGTYTVCLQIATNNGCKSEYCSQLQVIDSSNVCNIIAQYKYYKDTLDCKKIHFINSSSLVSPNVHFIWKFGDGTTSQETKPVHAYTQPGKYYVCLVGEAGTNCRKEYCDSVIVNCETSCNITARYEYKKDSLDCKKIHFKNLSLSASSDIHFAWKFGDGTTSHDINPDHIYSQPGKYYVCLVSEAGSNCRKEYCDSVIVRCENSCTISARFEWSKDSSDCKKIRFQNIAATFAVNTHFAWKFGDGDGSYDTNPTHLYSKPGVYQVCLVVEAGNNCSKYYCDTVTVRCEDKCNVKARFETKRDATQWNTVYFYNVSQPSANIAHAYWSYGDGASSNDYNGAHKYTTPGLYTVCLKVISTNGCISAYCDSVRINKPDSCALNATFSHYTYAAELLTVKFEASYHGDNTSYYWKFGDDAAATGRIVYHVYNKPGRYTVCLTVKNDQCSVTRCTEFNVARQSNDSGRVTIYPNPAVNTVSVDVTLDRPELVSIRFIDGNGVARETFKLNGVAGYNKFMLPIQQLSRGIYMVEIKTSIGMWYIRFMKG